MNKKPRCSGHSECHTRCQRYLHTGETKLRKRRCCRGGGRGWTKLLHLLRWCEEIYRWKNWCTSLSIVKLNCVLGISTPNSFFVGWPLVWANYSDLSRGHLNLRLSKGTPPKKNHLNSGLGIIVTCPDSWMEHSMCNFFKDTCIFQRVLRTKKPKGCSTPFGRPRYKV